MKKIVLSFVVIIAMTSCDSLKNVNTSNVSDAATLLGSLSSNSTVQQITSLFSLLDINQDESISSLEAIGSVAENFNILDTDNSSGLDLTEFTGLLGLLK
jgi:Ca2+-binding EF-hand superfamily protein